MHPMLNIAIQAARSASKIILRFVDHLDAVDVSEKNHNDIVTQVDQLSEQEIISHIRKSYPNHSILGEEGGYSEGDEYTWVIDPLDGTANFVHGFPQFAISIAVKRKEELEVAVIYDPLRQELFTATKGDGAKLNNRRMRVSEIKKLDQALVGTGFPFRNSQHFKPYMNTFQTIFPLTAGVRRAGAAALDLAYVAAGRLDGFWEAALKEWDMAAGVLLIKEAGGYVTDYQGGDDFLDSGNVIAGNPKIHKQLVEAVQQSLEMVT